MSTRKLEKGCITRIRWQDQRITVTVVVVIQGGDLIAVDRQGRLYTTYWTTQAQDDGKLHLGLRRWRRFEHGLFYLGRALEHALASTEEVKIPSLQELQVFCREKNAQISLLEGSVLPHLEAMTGQFEQLWQFLKSKRNRALKESRQHLSFFLLLRDSLGRVNIGVLQARLASIDYRFMKELEHLAGWMPHYAARIQAVRGLQQQFFQDVRNLSRSLGAMTTHEAFRIGRTTDKQAKAMASVLRRHIEVISQLQAIQPFVRWATYCRDDLNKAEQQIERHDFSAALITVNRLLESMKIRLVGFELEELISRMSLDMIQGQAIRNATRYIDCIAKLYAQLERIDDSTFAEPCRYEIISKIAVARTALGTFLFARAKTALKEAAAII